VIARPWLAGATDLGAFREKRQDLPPILVVALCVAISVVLKV